MHRFSHYVKAANYVTMVNGNAPLRAWDDELTLTPVYDVFRLYQEMMVGSAVAVDVAGHRYELTPFEGVSAPHQRTVSLSAPLVDASAALDAGAGRLTVCLINRDASRPVTSGIELDSASDYQLRRATRLYGEKPDSLTACIDEPLNVAVTVAPQRWEIELQPLSIVWLSWQLPLS